MIGMSECIQDLLSAPTHTSDPRQVCLIVGSPTLTRFSILTPHHHHQIDADFGDEDDTEGDGDTSTPDRPARKFTVRATLCLGATPPDTATTAAARVKLQLRALHSSGTIRLVRTNIEEHRNQQTGSRVLWAFAIADIYAAVMRPHPATTNWPRSR